MLFLSKALVLFKTNYAVVQAAASWQHYAFLSFIYAFGRWVGHINHDACSFFFFSVLCWCFSLFTDVCYSTFFYNQHSFLLFSHFSLYDLEVWLLIMRHIHNLINTLYGRKHVDTQNAFKIKHMGINKGLSFLCCYNILHSSQTIAQSWNRLNVTWIKGPSINIINWGSQTFGRVM